MDLNKALADITAIRSQMARGTEFQGYGPATVAATEQFIPAGVAGALLTVVLFRIAPESLWMLPGLWQIVFSLGFFASCRSLPRPMLAVGVWYLAAGLASLAFANGTQAFAPWAMALPFGLGQLLMAGILYRSGISDAET